MGKATEIARVVGHAPRFIRGALYKCGVLRPLRPRVTFVLAKVTKTVSPRKASPAHNAGARTPRWPQEVRIRDIPIPDAHARNPFRAPLGSTSALPRGSARLRGRTPPRFSEGAVGPRMARLSDASLCPQARRGAGMDPARHSPAQGTCCRVTVRQRRVRAGAAAPFRGSVSLGPFLSRQERSSPSGARTRFK